MPEMSHMILAKSWYYYINDWRRSDIADNNATKLSIKWKSVPFVRELRHRYQHQTYDIQTFAFKKKMFDDDLLTKKYLHSYYIYDIKRYIG